MEEKKYKILINGEEKEYAAGTTFLEIAQQYQHQYQVDIVLVLFNNRLRELWKKVKTGGELSFVTTKDKAGRKAYRRSITLLMQRAVYNLAKEDKKQVSVKVEHSIGQGYYCELLGETADEAYIPGL